MEDSFYPTPSRYSRQVGQLLPHLRRIFSTGRTASTLPEQDIMYRVDSLYPTWAEYCLQERQLLLYLSGLFSTGKKAYILLEWDIFHREDSFYPTSVVSAPQAGQPPTYLSGIFPKEQPPPYLSVIFFTGGRRPPYLNRIFFGRRMALPYLSRMFPIGEGWLRLTWAGYSPRGARPRPGGSCPPRGRGPWRQTRGRFGPGGKPRAPPGRRSRRRAGRGCGTVLRSAPWPA